MKKSFNSKQIAILQYIYDQTHAQGYPPTVREIGNAVGLSSTSTVHGHISQLSERGLLIKDPAKPRALEITQTGLKTICISENYNHIPIIGTVSAGQPIFAVQEAIDYFPVPNKFEKEVNDMFMLTIKGDSMINIGILNGDQVIVHHQNSAKNGEIVIAMNENDEATCKRFFKEDHYYRLQPENDKIPPIILNSVTILGKVVGLYREDI